MLLEHDPRLIKILDKIGKIAALNFTDELETSPENDTIDAISLGLNMLSEELQLNVVERSKLHHVNDKLQKFALTAAHDLKAPINSISGLVEIFDYSLKQKDSKEMLKCLEVLKKLTEDMKEMVYGILDYSRLDTSEIGFEPVSIELLLQNIISTDRLDSQANIQIEPALPVVNFNKTLLIQIFRNLLVNAIKYNDKPCCEIIVSSLEKGDRFEIIVADNGPGIAKENVEEIFKLFNRIDGAPGEGHGIGLASVKNILESFKEQIWVDPKIDQPGARFHFTIKK